VFAAHSATSLGRLAGAGADLKPELRGQPVLFPVPTAEPDSTRAWSPVVVAEHATEALAAEHGTNGRHGRDGRPDDRVVEALVVPVGVIVSDELG
jgi:hypothetical protein